MREFPQNNKSDKIIPPVAKFLENGFDSFRRTKYSEFFLSGQLYTRKNTCTRMHYLLDKNNIKHIADFRYSIDRLLDLIFYVNS